METAQRNQKQGRKKTTFRADTPFSKVEWPKISLEDQDTILELLLNLLEPLGHYRRHEIKPSRGKKSRKRKRNADDSRVQADVTMAEPSLPIPEIAQYVDCGLATISRTLQDMAALGSAGDDKVSEDLDEVKSTRQQYAAVFVARSGHPSAFHSHFPIMVCSASQARSSQPIRLVGFSKASEERLSAALGIPRVSSIGLLRDAPHSKALLQFIDEHVPVVSASWMTKGAKLPSEFQPTNIEVLEVPVGQGKQKKIKSNS